MNDNAIPNRASSAKDGCRSTSARSRRDLPLREDCRYRKARMLVLLAYNATNPRAPAAVAESPAALELRRAAVAAGGAVIREHEGLRDPIEPVLFKLGDALVRGEREGWLDAAAAERLRRLSSELAAV
jgi:hypothetical protein